MSTASFSRLMLGTVQFGLNYGIANTAGKPSLDRVKEILRLACDHGIDALDTAPSYGDSEEVIGLALAELGIAGKFRLVTKISPIPEDADPAEFIETSLRNSLRRLKTKQIAVALMHAEQDVRHLEVLQSMVAKGLIAGAGVSVNTLEYEAKVEHADYLQIPCNVMDHRFDRLFRVPRRHNFIRSVYLQGLLLMPEETMFLKELVPYRRKLEALGMPMAELCMRYLFALPGNPSVLTGVETPEQLRENIRLAELGPLDPEMFAKTAACIPSLNEKWISPAFWTEYKK